MSSDTDESKIEPPKVALGEGEELPVAALELTLAIGSGPLLKIQPMTAELIPRELRREQFGSKLRGKLVWGKANLDFRFLGTHENVQGAIEIHGLVLSENLLGWFQTILNPAASSSDSGSSDASGDAKKDTPEGQRPWMVYQRQTADSRGWSFVRRVLGDKFEEPSFAEKFEHWFETGVCLLRPSGWTQLAHINRIVQLLGGLPGAVCGWCVFATPQDDDALRFVAGEDTRLELDDKWRLRSDSGNRVPHELADTGEPFNVVRRFVGIDPSLASEIVGRLATSGRRTTLEEGFEGGDSGDDADKSKDQATSPLTVIKQIPHMPMPVKLRDSDYLCERSTLRFSSPHALLSTANPGVLDIELSLRALPARRWGSQIHLRAKGTFGKWDEPSGKKRLRINSTDQPWVLIGDDGDDDAGSPTDRKAAAEGLALLCESVTPYAARGEFAGFYVKHQEKDELVIELGDLSVPRTHGGLQVYAEQLETPELTLNSGTIVITGVGKTEKLNVTGVRFSGGEGFVDIYAEQHVKIKEKITVVAENSTFEHDVTIKGKLDVKKDTALESNLEVTGDTKIKGKADVGK
ncbi:MAG TPA: hypothetical protein VHM70_16555 [Polyangiaceae bacterium]|nr:hypothetical protein [Polyangiaceae bacterium]